MRDPEPPSDQDTDGDDDRPDKDPARVVGDFGGDGQSDKGGDSDTAD